MLSLRVCSFCGEEFSQGQGLMLVKNDGSTEFYCSSKCRKNFTVLRRDPRKFKWTKLHSKGKRSG